MKFILISPKNRTTYNFRGDLIKLLVSSGYEVIVTGPNEDGIDKIKELGVRFVHIPLDKNGLSILGDLKYLVALKRLFKQEKPDVTLGYTIKPVIYGSLAAKLARVKNINAMITGAGYVFTANTLKSKIIRRLASMLYKVGLGCANHVIFQNKDDMEEFVKLSLVKSKKCSIVNGSGVNMTKFSKQPLPETITFFMLSRAMYSKGVLEYLEAAKVIKDDYPEVRFMLLGAVENIQDSLKVEQLKPYIDNGIIDYYGETNDVMAYYKQCSVYVLPSYREGTPRTVLESMAIGRPILTTDAPGCKETVEEGINGFKVPVKDVKALVDKMKWFINHQEKIEKMGQASWEYCKEKYDVNKVNQDMLSSMKLNNK